MITFNKVNEILKTLPVGYYLGGAIDCTLEDSDQSYHSPVENKIVIGYKQLPLDKLNENDPEVENMVRCMLYHEVSHAILTPEMRMTEYLNIFEDQRIETLLKDFYHRVNFEKFVRKVNNHIAPTIPSTPDEYYYQIVRYGEGPKEFVDWRDSIIHKYRNVNSRTWSSRVISYELTVREFYEAIVKEFNNQMENKPSDMNLNNLTVNLNKEVEKLDDAKKQELQETIATIFENKISPIINRFNNPALTSQVKTIFENARKKKGMQAGALKTYSGKLNPKLINRPGKIETYKWWEKASQNSDSNRFSKIQLNLFCDVSSSFMNSSDKLNELITSLIKVEKLNKDFKLNIVKIGTTVRYDKKREVTCDEGSCLTTNIINIYKSLQTPNTSIYNLVVFDGDIQEGLRSYEKDKRAFKAFNHPNCIVISDPSNKGPLDKHAPNAKRIYVDNNYADTFQANVLEALRLLVR